ncbi:MAG TPA: helix-turn-helix domain-containing protein, partial [Vicinamibacteria bacterium]|nr:helix-turn-helix domain-containing protein [Vicinamibacteria bacterium]
GRVVPSPAPAAASGAAVAETLPQAEGAEEGPDPARVRAALEQARWRREKAAEILGVSPRTLYRWIKKLEL